MLGGCLILGSCLALGGCLMLLGACSSSPLVSPRERSDFNADWRFHLGDGLQAAQPGFADNDWRVLDLPHDWAIEGDFSQENPSGTGGGALPGGVGWYRKIFSVDKADAGKIFRIEFDGVYMNSEVFINGVSLGVRPYGYISFSYDLTPYLKWDEPNVLAVRVDNAEQPNSRWYSGCGIYRNVWLSKTGPIHVGGWGTYVTTSSVDEKQAVLNLATTLVNESDTNENVTVCSSLQDAEGREVAETRSSGKAEAGKEVVFTQQLTVKQPQLWDIDTPYLYTLVTKVMRNEECMDRYTTPVGIRTFSFDARKGFTLNGRQTKINGVCMHHDLGCLGAAVNTRAIERQLQILKEMGCNGIRCSHNPPAPELLDLCDRMGFIVMDEAFDMWRQGHYKDDYGQYFDKLWKEDLYSMVARDRNHPCVIMWSIGNEIKDKETAEVVEVCRELTGFVKTLDTTRPVTAGVNSIVDATDDFLAPLDVCGYNYCLNRYESDAKRHPDRIIYASESYASQAYDYWKGVEDHSWVIGDFIWTAFDYIGEASIGWCGYPLDKRIFPWNHANCGDLNLSGERRPQSYLRETLWSDAPVSHIVVTPPVPSFPLNPNKADWSVWDFPDVVDHWNFPGYEGKKMTVSVYSNCEQVELFLNGESLGKQENTADKKNTLVWEVPYAHGILKAVSYNKGGEVGTATLESAGKVEKIRLSADRTEIVADGNDLSYITLELVDSKGIRNQLAEELVEFSIAGDATIEGVGNANPMSIESFVANSRKTWRGSNLLVVRSGKSSGRIIVTAKVKALPVASITITQKK